MSNIFVPPKRFPNYFEMILIPNENVESLKIAPTEQNLQTEICPIQGGDNIFRLPASVFDSEYWSQEQKDLLVTLCGGPAFGSIQELESDIFCGPLGIHTMNDLNAEQINRLEEIQNGDRAGRLLGKRFALTEMKKS